jgi:hypothetical protein
LDDVFPTSIARNARSLWLPLEICLGMIYNGKIQDAMTIIALLTHSVRTCSEGNMKNKPGREINPVCAIQGMNAGFSGA